MTENGRVGGGDLTRQLSTSHFEVRSLLGYQDFFNRSSSKESGWMEISVDGKGFKWYKKYAELCDGALAFTNNAEGDDTYDFNAIIPDETSSSSIFSNIDNSFTMPLTEVVSVRVESKLSNHKSDALVIKTATAGEMRIRTTTSDELNRWTFAFQKSVALVLTKLISIDGNTNDLLHSSLDRENLDENGVKINGKKMELGTLDDFGRRIRAQNTMVRLNTTRSHAFPNGRILSDTVDDTVNTSYQRSRSISSNIPVPKASGRDGSKESSESAELRGDRGDPGDLFQQIQSAYNEMQEGQGSGHDEESLGDLQRDLYDLGNEASEGIFDMDGAEADADEQYHYGDSSDDGLESSGRLSVDYGSYTNGNNISHSSGSSSSSRSKSRRKAMHVISGCSTKQGNRKTNEDRMVEIADLKKELGFGMNYEAFYAVYDGHCGNEAAEFLEAELHLRISKTREGWQGSLADAISESCIDADKDFIQLCKEENWYSGSTALGVIVNMSVCEGERNGSEFIGRITVFNIGDCQGILCRVKDEKENNDEVIPLSVCHRPDIQEEADRVMNAGGWITEDRELYIGRLQLMDLKDPLVREKAQKVEFTTIRRICGDLAISRSIGDPDYKNLGENTQSVETFYFNFPQDHPGTFTGDLVIPDPDITEFDISVKDEFLILATDGLWDVIELNEAARLTRIYFQDGNSPSEAADKLATHALRLGSSDNVTVIVLRFQATDPSS